MSDNIVLGRGKLYFDPFATGTETKTGERYFGNTPSFGLNIESETLDHYNADEGVKNKDLTVTLQTTYTGNFVTDNISPENIALMFMGSSAVVAQTSLTGEVDTITVKQDRYYQLGEDASNPTGKRNVTVTTVEPAGGGTAFVVATDYTVDDTTGRLYIVPGGGIADDTALDITYNVAASSRQTIISGADQIYGAMRFVAFNPVGDQKDFYMPKVALTPNGEYALKGDDWQQISLSAEILKLGTGANIYVDGRPYTP